MAPVPDEATWLPLLRAVRASTGADLAYIAEESPSAERLRVRAVTGTTEVDETDIGSSCPALVPIGAASPHVADPDVLAGTDLGRRGFTVHVAAPVRASSDVGAGWFVLAVASAADDIDTDRVPDVLASFAPLVAQLVEDRAELITTSARAIAAEGRVASLRRFADETRHALKTPVAVATGWMDLLDTAEVRDEGWQAGRAAIQRTLREVDAIIDGLQEASHAHAISRRDRAEPVAIADFLREFVGDLRAANGGHQLELNHRSEDEDVSVHLDRDALRTVMNHLVENAMKYSGTDAPVTIRLGVTDAGRVAIEVIDRGAGLPEGIDVFEPYVRGDDTVPGSGLGLHIVQEIVHALGGDVLAEDDAEHGTTFRVLLTAQGRRPPRSPATSSPGRER